MTDLRMAREKEHDRFVAEANMDFVRLAVSPTDEVLDRIAAVDPHLYGRLVEGDRWINAKINDYLAGELADLDNVRAGWSDWLRLFAHGVKLLEVGDKKPRSPGATTSKPGPNEGAKAG